MANFSTLVLHCFSFFLVFFFFIYYTSADEDRKLHIVYMGLLPKEKYSPSSHHLSLLQEVIESSSVESLLVTSYKRSFNGFAAKISDYEARKLASRREVVSVFPSRTYQLQTTRSWSFIGFNETTRQNLDAESSIIVGVFDTGIWPESESFNDKGFGPPPKKWKGSCDGGQNFTCNNKIIGARYYTALDPAIDSARDDIGHGTHTASTAAGNKVNDASFFGLANGTARGGVPSARIAAYKVCGPNGCSDADILGAFDDAIADGVDIISISLGNSNAVDYSNDIIAIGAFHAMDKGILTSHSAGNSGPQSGSVSSVAPWILSVAASSTDRRIIDKVVLGNKNTLIGNSVNSFALEGENFPLINGINAQTTDCFNGFASSCPENCLNSSLVKGKIVLCDDSKGIDEAKRAGAIGSITGNGGFDDVSFVVPLPAVALTPENYAAVGTYTNSSENPSANILKSEAIKDSAAPIVASFSSRGPNVITPDILKPDISAPGVNILAAFPSNIPPTSNPEDTRLVKFNFLSGTSMSCPHATGVAAYVKTFHPDWSPSAIKSAIMTTAFPMNASENSEAEFAYGSGHVNPLKAINPGLVYDAHKTDYIKFLCSIKDNNEDLVRRISGDNSTCPQGDKESQWNLNYPSMSSRFPPKKSFTIKFQRTVTNVGIANSIYKAEVFTTSKLRIKVDPDVLSFESINQKLSFSVTVDSDGLSSDENIVSASLVWSDGSHTVRSPIVIHTFGAA